MEEGLEVDESVVLEVEGLGWDMRIEEDLVERSQSTVSPHGGREGRGKQGGKGGKGKGE